MRKKKNPNVVRMSVEEVAYTILAIFTEDCLELAKAKHGKDFSEKLAVIFDQVAGGEDDE